MTPGITEETVDGWSGEKGAKILEAIRDERWQWTPVKRVFIDKPKGGKRPLGLPVWSDKVVQDIIRSILEAYYEPQFSTYSHGFRPKRGCHTALNEVVETWMGSKWFIEGDIKGCFDNIDHVILMNILRENIQDNRFLRLIEGALQAGYCEEWTFHPSLSGSPQGGVVTLLTKLQTWCESSRRVFRVHNCVLGMGMGFWVPHSTWCPPGTVPHPRSKETVVARRADTPHQILEVHRTFEPGHISPACVVQAYEWVVPIRRRTALSKTRPTAQAGQPRPQQPVRRRDAA